MKNIWIFSFLIIIALISGCASAPAPRPELEGLGSLDQNLSRIYVSAGELGGRKLWSVNQVGPFFINDKKVGSTAKNEYSVVDLLPGTYEIYCTQEKPDKKTIQ